MLTLNDEKDSRRISLTRVFFLEGELQMTNYCYSHCKASDRPGRQEECDFYEEGVKLNSCRFLVSIDYCKSPRAQRDRIDEGPPKK